MTFEETLVDVIATTGAHALVGDRVFPLSAAQDAVTPYVVYRLYGGEPFNAHDGATGVSRLRVELNVVADTYAAARAVATALDALNGTGYAPGAIFYMRVSRAVGDFAPGSGEMGRSMLRLDLQAIFGGE